LAVPDLCREHGISSVTCCKLRARYQGRRGQAVCATITPDALETLKFVAGMMGPKLTAAFALARAGGRMAGIGRLRHARAIVEGPAGRQPGAP